MDGFRRSPTPSPTYDTTPAVTETALSDLGQSIPLLAPASSGDDNNNLGQSTTAVAPVTSADSAAGIKTTTSTGGNMLPSSTTAPPKKPSSSSKAFEPVGLDRLPKKFVAHLCKRLSELAPEGYKAVMRGKAERGEFDHVEVRIQLCLWRSVPVCVSGCG